MSARRASESTEKPERLSWEYADGPRVGTDVPITGPPRSGDTFETSAADKAADGPSAPPRTEYRAVLAEDPELPADLNQRLTTELREIVGADRLRVPADRPHATRGEHPEQHGVGAYLSMHRFQLIRATAIALTFGAIIALITADWWILPLAAGIHALGTMTVVITIVRMTTTIEHPSPELAAALADAGVHNPDEYFSRMVEEFQAEPERGAAEVLSPGFNERTQEASVDPVGAAAEQSSAMTPTAEPSRPGGEGSLPEVVNWTVTLALLALSIAIPAAIGGWMWLLTAVMVPLLAGWGVMQWAMKARQPHVSQGLLVAVIPCTALAVAAFCAVVALAFHH